MGILMKPGQARIPTEILEKRGSWLAPRRKKDGVIMAELGRPTMPKILNARARAVWRRTIPVLESYGVLTPGDVTALVRYCDTVADYEAAMEERDNGSEDIVKLRQYMTQLRAAMRQDEAKFGLTPSDRASITRPQQANKVKDDDNSIKDTILRLRNG